MVSTMSKINPNSCDNRWPVVHRFTKPSNAAKRFPGIVRIVPRKKTMGQEKIERDSDCVEISIQKIKALSYLSQTAAAKKLGLSLTALKHACRTLGYNKWPRDHEFSARVNRRPTTPMDSVPATFVEAPCALMKVRQGPTAHMEMQPCEIVNCTEQANSVPVETESNKTTSLRNKAAVPQLKNQDSFDCLELALNTFPDEEKTAAEGYAHILAAGKERPGANTDEEVPKRGLCQLSALALPDRNEDKEPTQAGGDMEWEDDLQNFLHSMEEEDERHLDFGFVSDFDFEFGRQCFEHARLAKENRLWSMALPVA